MYCSAIQQTKGVGEPCYTRPFGDLNSLYLDVFLYPVIWFCSWLKLADLHLCGPIWGQGKKEWKTRSDRLSSGSWHILYMLFQFLSHCSKLSHMASAVSSRPARLQASILEFWSLIPKEVRRKWILVVSCNI